MLGMSAASMTLTSRMPVGMSTASKSPCDMHRHVLNASASQQEGVKLPLLSPAS